MAELIYSAKQVEDLISQLAKDVLKDYRELSGVALVGIRTGGIFLAQRLQKHFEQATGKRLPLGILDINLYRDDFDLGNRQPEVRESEIDFAVQGHTLLLVDDVLFTGRTVRAALEALNDYGRPAAVRLAVLVDRGHRELPVQADYCATKIETSRQEIIKVTFAEEGEEDKVERIPLPASKS